MIVVRGWSVVVFVVKGWSVVVLMLELLGNAKWDVVHILSAGNQRDPATLYLAIRAARYV